VINQTNRSAERSLSGMTFPSILFSKPHKANIELLGSANSSLRSINRNPLISINNIINFDINKSTLWHLIDKISSANCSENQLTQLFSISSISDLAPICCCGNKGRLISAAPHAKSSSFRARQCRENNGDKDSNQRV
jgi:hypothetical protein